MIAVLKKIIMCLLPSILYSVVISLNYNNINMYNNLDKPLWALPIWILIMIWGILYIAIGISNYRIFMNSNNTSNFNFYFIVQILLCFIAAFLFFSFRLYGLTFIVSVLNLIFIIIATSKAFNIDIVSAIIMTMYTIWNGYNIYILCFIWMKNEM